MYEIYMLGHSVILTNDILEEWNKHHSKYSRSWYVKMLRRGKIIHYRHDTDDGDLRIKVLNAIEENAHQAVLKDMRLVEASLLEEADQIVSSMDDKMRNHFRRACESVEELQAVIWINPSKENENCIIWLREGALAEDHRRLDYIEE